MGCEVNADATTRRFLDLVAEYRQLLSGGEWTTLDESDQSELDQLIYDRAMDKLSAECSREQWAAFMSAAQAPKRRGNSTLTNAPDHKPTNDRRSVRRRRAALDLLMFEKGAVEVLVEQNGTRWTARIAGLEYRGDGPSQAEAVDHLADAMVEAFAAERWLNLNRLDRTRFVPRVVDSSRGRPL